MPQEEYSQAQQPSIATENDELEQKMDAPAIDAVIGTFLQKKLEEGKQLQDIELSKELDKNKTILGKDSLGNIILAGDVFFDFRTRKLFLIDAINCREVTQGLVINSDVSLMKDLEEPTLQESEIFESLLGAMDFRESIQESEQSEQEASRPSVAFHPRRVERTDLLFQGKKTFKDILAEANYYFWKTTNLGQDLLRDERLRAVVASHKEALKKQFELWATYREQVSLADTLILPTRGGLGDRPYMFLMARILAKTYPQKRVILVETNPAMRALYDTSKENIEVIESFDDALESLDRPKEHSTVVLDGMPIGVSEDRDGLLISVMRFEKKHPETVEHAQSQPPKSALDKIKKAFGLVKPTAQAGITFVPDSALPSRSNRENIYYSVWSAWKRLGYQTAGNTTKNAEQEALVQSVSDIYSKDYNSVSDTLTGQQHSLHQFETIAGQMTNLLGCDPTLVADVLMENPLKINSEIASEKTYDVVFAYDAGTSKNGVATKCLYPKQLKESYEGIKAKNPDAKVGIVVGKTNKELTRMILEACPDVEIIDGSLEYVLEECLKSKVLVLPDTGIAHMINFLKRTHQSSTDKLPRVVAAFGLRVGFSPWFFGPDAAESMIVTNGPAREIRSDTLITEVNHQLASWEAAAAA